MNHRALPLLPWLILAISSNACDSTNSVGRPDGGSGAGAGAIAGASGAAGKGGPIGTGAMAGAGRGGDTAASTGGSGSGGGSAGGGGHADAGIEGGASGGTGTGANAGSGAAGLAVGGHGTGGIGAGGAGGGGRVAVAHRAVAEICGMERAAGTCQPINVAGTTGFCAADSSCTAGTNGRCLAGGRVGGCSCSYDSCFADSDCKLGGPCACRGTGTAGANACLAGNCRVDADCGPGGSCSPTYDFGCGRYFGIVGYYCHTKNDACLDDSDCATAGAPSNVPAADCRHNPATGAWSCETGQCAG